MMSALKITALRMALWGEESFITLSAAIARKVTINMAGIIAKYLATSLAVGEFLDRPDQRIEPGFPFRIEHLGQIDSERFGDQGEEGDDHDDVEEIGHASDAW